MKALLNIGNDQEKSIKQLKDSIIEIIEVCKDCNMDQATTQKALDILLQGAPIHANISNCSFISKTK
jgi:hypothetical protein